MLSYHRTHVFRSNGIWELPFGPGKLLGRNSQGVLARILERWQIGAIFNRLSGPPLSLTTAITSWNSFAGNSPTSLVPFSAHAGEVLKQGDGVVYFQGLRVAPDPSIAGLTTLQGIQSRSTRQAIADADGKLIFINPTPGTLGTAGNRTIYGPGLFRFDVNLVKRFKIREGMNLEVRADFIDVLNTPQFGAPDLDINSINFGRITAATGSRIIVLNARFNF